MTDEIVLGSSGDVEGRIRRDLDGLKEPKSRRRFKKLFLAALGSIPWIGGFLSGLGSLRDEERQGQAKELHREWLEEHGAKFVGLGQTLGVMTERLEQFGEEVQERIESPEYLGLVRKAFRAWDKADTQEKRDLLQKLLSNAGASTLAPDDLVALFIEWIDKYNEAHFKVIRVIYQYPGATRAEIWDQIHGTEVREDSAEADLLKLLIRDLSTGSVVRQVRATDSGGRFLRKPPARSKRGHASPYMKSAFDDKEQYVLTNLGEKFVHYTMDELVPRIGGSE